MNIDKAIRNFKMYMLFDIPLIGIYKYLYDYIENNLPILECYQDVSINDSVLLYIGNEKDLLLHYYLNDKSVAFNETILERLISNMELDISYECLSELLYIFINHNYSFPKMVNNNIYSYGFQIAIKDKDLIRYI